MKTGIKPILLTFIVIMIAIPFIINNADNLNPITSAQFQNDTQNISTARLAGNGINASINYTVTKTPLLTSNLSLESFAIYNSSGSVATITTDYLVDLSTGVYSLKNSSFWIASGNITYVTYNYFDDSYITDSGSRNILLLTVFFMALGLLAWVIYYNWEYVENLIGR